MFNLLPLEQKQKIHREYFMRLLTVACLFILVVVVIAVIFLIPLYVLSRSMEQDEISAKNTLLAVTSLKEADLIKKDIGELRAKIKVLEVSENGRHPSTVIESLVAAKPAGISIESISYRNTGGEEGELVVKGEARDRETLTLFLKKVRESKDFSGVTIPISDFAGKEDISFTLTAKGNF